MSCGHLWGDYSHIKIKILLYVFITCNKHNKTLLQFLVFFLGNLIKFCFYSNLTFGMFCNLKDI